MSLFSFLLARAQWVEKCVRLLGGKQIFSNMLKNQFVKSTHRYTVTLAAGLTRAHLIGAGVIAIATTLSCLRGHPIAAMRTRNETRKEDIAGHDSRWGLFRIPGIKEVAQLQEFIFGYDGRDLQRYFHTSIFTAAERKLARICSIGKVAMHTAHAPFFASSRAIPSLIEPACDCLDAHGAGRAVTLESKIEHATHHACIAFINHQAFFPGLSAPFDFHNFVPEGRVAAVPETLQGVFVEAAPDMFCCLQ
nr:hypothetical protein [Pseudophaeobacter sp. EL27]